MRSRLLLMMAGTAAFTIAGGCGGDDKKDLDDEASIEEVFAAFQPSILRITSAGLAAKETAQGANIPEFVLDGLVSGTAGIGGTVAQSGGGNENLSLYLGMTDYSDEGDIAFSTDNTSEATKLQFDLQVQVQPQDNTMNGTLAGDLVVSGDREGEGSFDLAFVSDLDDDNADPFLICSHVTGTVIVEEETLPVDFVVPATLDSAMQLACSQL